MVIDTTASAVSFGEEVAFTQTFSYLRSNHFSDWLSRIQEKESYVVGNDVVEEVMRGLAERNVAPQDVNQQIVLKVMKAKKMKSKSYNYSSQVCMRDENNRSSARSAEFGA